MNRPPEFSQQKFLDVYAGCNSRTTITPKPSCSFNSGWCLQALHTRTGTLAVHTRVCTHSPRPGSGPQHPDTRPPDTRPPGQHPRRTRTASPAGSRTVTLEDVSGQPMLSPDLQPEFQPHPPSLIAVFLPQWDPVKSPHCASSLCLFLYQNCPTPWAVPPGESRPGLPPMHRVLARKE